MKIIIFDYDGVIVDSLDAYEKTVISAFQQNGYPQIRSRESFLNLFEGNFFQGAVEAGIPADKMSAVLKEMEPELLSVQSQLRFFDGMRETLAKLAQSHKIFVATSNLTSVVESNLKAHNITSFEEIIGADKEISKVKKIENIKAKYPDRQIFYVGDTKGDMVEGKLAGVQTIAVTWGWHKAEKLKEGRPDHIAENPSELLAIIER